MLLRAITLSVLALIASAASADDLEIESKGELGLETRVFWPDETAATDVGNVAVAGRLQVDAEKDVYSARARLFTRLDPNDSVRTRVVPEELFVEASSDPIRLRAGYQMLNWTATEAFHPADIINSRILDGSFENPEKIGEPIAALRIEIPMGNLELYAMPVFTAPLLASSQSPLSLAPPGIPLGEPLVLEQSGHITANSIQRQWGVQVQQTWGDADIALHFVQQIDRSAPLVLFDFGAGELHPVFQAVSQAGLTYSHVLDRTILKLEGAFRVFDRPDNGISQLGRIPRRNHMLAALGIEQGVSRGDGSETSLLLEGQALIPVQAAYPDLLQPLFQHDVLIGVRHAFNDEQSTALLVTAIFDVKHPDQIIAGASLSRRLGEEWGLTTGLRIMRIPPVHKNAPVLFERLHDQHQLYVDIKRYF